MDACATDGGGSRFLQGLVVLELGGRVAAGACGGLLARLGAEVVLVEPRQARSQGKWARRAMAAAGKRSLVLEGDAPADRRLLQDLLAHADVVLLSSDEDAAQAALWSGERPRHQLVCDLTAYGHTGPLAGVEHPEALVQAQAGVAHTTGRRDGPPLLSGAPFLDMETAAYAAAAILAALRVRRRTGCGQRIDMTLYDVAVNALLTFLPLHTVGRPAMRNGNRHPTSAPWNAFHARDGWLMLCAPTNDQWRRLCDAMGRPELVADPRFATPTGRFENVEALDREIGAWVGQLTVADCLAQVAAQDLPCSPILPLDGLAGEPNLRHRAMVQAAVDPLTGATVHVCGSPFRVTGERPVALSVPAPDSGRVAVGAWLARQVSASLRVHGDPPLRGRPLEGVRVVEIGMNTVAPLAARQLGALGADVIKVEPPAGDTNRINAPLRADGQAYVFALSNTDKRGIVLDLKTEQDRATLWRLLETADLAIENLKPGTLDKLGFGARAVRERLPKLVYCSVNGFGHDTVYPGRPALDTVIQAMSGAMAATPQDGIPTKAGISISDQLGGQFGLVALLAALERRERTGQGLALDLAMQDMSAWATERVWGGLPNEPQARIVEREGSFRAELLAPLGEGRVRVLSVAEVLAHPQTAARGLLKTVPTADGSEWQVLGCPLHLLSTPPEVRSAMPRLGFLDEALARELGLATAQEQEEAA